MVIYFNLKRIARLNASKMVMSTKIRMLLTFIAAVNDHDSVCATAVTATKNYIDLRWVFGFLKKKNMHPNMVMTSSLYESIFWAVDYLENNKDTKFVNF